MKEPLAIIGIGGLVFQAIIGITLIHHISYSIDRKIKPTIINQEQFKIIDAKQIDSSTTYSVGLNKGDGYFNITQSLDKFSAMGIDCDSIILYSNL